MKLDRLTSSTAQAVASDHSHSPQGAAVPPVEGMDAATPDRRHSLRQDLEEIEAQALAPFQGQELILQQAHEVAEKIANLGQEAAHLVRCESTKSLWHVVDDQA